jgi:hypothetical protein
LFSFLERRQEIRDECIIRRNRSEQEHGQDTRHNKQATEKLDGQTRDRTAKDK